jgi:hypothetical protein
LKLKILTDIKIKIKEKPNFFTIGPVVFSPGTQTCATELKKWTIGTQGSNPTNES